MIRNAFILIVAAFICVSAAMAFPGLHGSVYVAPCNTGSISCGAAHSVTQQMISTYSGPLFQLNNGTTTLDVGFDATTKKTDMTTWSAFCSGVASNCKISKIYGQVNGNDLVPSIYFSGGCDTGGALVCAAALVIDGATGLPIIKAGLASDANWKAQYTLTGDGTATGINGGTTATSVWLSGQVPPSDAAPCCGVYGISHSVVQANTAGTDFLIFLDYTNNFPPNSAVCASSHCLSVDLEGAVSPYGAYAATDGDNANWLVTWTGSGTNTFTGFYNGTQLYSGTGDAGQNTPTHIHLGGGGDLTQPAKVIFRSGFIANGAVSSTDAATLKTNQAAFLGVTYH